MMTMSASSSSSARSLRSAPCHTMWLSDGENLSISRSQLVTTLVGATMSALNFFLPSAFASFSTGAFTARRSAMRLHRLAETHVVGEDAARADLVEEPEPLEALLLIRAEQRLQVARLLDALDLVDVAELAEEVLRVGGDVRLADLIEELLDAPGLRERQLAPLPSARGEDLGLTEEDRLHLVDVDLRERAVLRGARSGGLRRGSDRAPPA